METSTALLERPAQEHLPPVEFAVPQPQPATEAVGLKDGANAIEPITTTFESNSVAEYTEIQPSRLLRVVKKAKRIAVGEGVGTALEAGMIAAGLPLPVREIAGTTVDIKTYGAEQKAAAGQGEEDKPSRLKKAGRIAGILALNLAAGYALQKGVPEAAHFIGGLADSETAHTAGQVAGKVGAMAGGTAVLNRRFGF